MSDFLLKRRRFLKHCAAFSAGTLFVTSCSQSQLASSALDLDDWSDAPDLERAKEQAKEFVTYGIPDDWANYGEVIQKFAQRYGFDLNHIDTDMASLQEIMKFDAEKNNARAICGDIGIVYAAIAEQKGVVPVYTPASAATLPTGLKGKDGGWIATYTGVPALVINADVIQTIPQTWSDLLAPEYKGKVGSFNPARSGIGANTFLAWSYANGGNEDNMTVAVEFAKKMILQFSSAPDNAQTLEKGEVPIHIDYDFNCNSIAEMLRAKNIKAEVIIPGVSIYAPSALILNKYNTAKMDVAKLFMDYVLSDEAQTAFAKFGARPIRYVLGDLELPDDVKTKWLPDDKYVQVQQIQDWTNVNAETIGRIWREDVMDDA
jgi:putative spermidine/putrescine transport system substrate-binding protein